MVKQDIYFQGLSQSNLLSGDFVMNDGSGAGGFILQRKQWENIDGIKDSNTHNRGQDLVTFHETSEICSHIDTATFGSFLLKLPRTKTGIRKKKMNYKNPLGFLQFQREKNLINLNNVYKIDNKNLPKNNLKLNTVLYNLK
jgi:hypothetical protein